MRANAPRRRAWPALRSGGVQDEADRHAHVDLRKLVRSGRRDLASGLTRRRAQERSQPRVKRDATTTSPFTLAALAVACIPARGDAAFAGSAQAPKPIAKRSPARWSASRWCPCRRHGHRDGTAIDVAPFYIGRTEVTWDMYDVFALGSTSRARRPAPMPSRVHRSPYGAPDYGWGHAGFPAISVTRRAAEAFCAWLSSKTGKPYRLPTEAEWAQAAQARQRRPGAGRGAARRARVAQRQRRGADARGGTESPTRWGCSICSATRPSGSLPATVPLVTRGGSFRDAGQRRSARRARRAGRCAGTNAIRSSPRAAGGCRTRLSSASRSCGNPESSAAIAIASHRQISRQDRETTARPRGPKLEVPMTESVPRRAFIQTTAAATAAFAFPSGVRVAGSDTIRVGLIGCGGRGTGAARDCLRGRRASSSSRWATSCPIGSRSRATSSRRPRPPTPTLAAQVQGHRRARASPASTPTRRCSPPDVDLVILATPPGFRPVHLAAAVEAGKHIFAEKPVAVDRGGVRSVLATLRAGEAEEARHRRRHAAPAPGRVHRDDQAHPRRRDRRRDERPGVLEPGRPLEPREAAGVDATSSGRSATGSTSPGSPAITSSSSTCTTSTSPTG